MADQYSARPTGTAVPCSRSGQSLEALQFLGFALSKRIIASLLVLIAGAHIALADGLSGTPNNALWPTLIMGYGLLFLTYLVLSDRKPLRAAQDLSSEPHLAAQSSSDKALGRHPVRSAGKKNEAGKLDPSAVRTDTTPLTITHRDLPRPVNAISRDTCPDWTDLMSQVSHELRTPLNAMIGFSDVMNAELLGPLENPKYREYLAHIRDSGHELLKSAEDTLAMTSLLANRPQFDGVTLTCNLNDTLLEAWSFVATDAKAQSITLELDVAAELCVTADNRPLRQTFVNLFAEALKHAGRDGIISLCAHQKGELVEIEVATTSDTPDDNHNAPSLPEAIARALLELQGTTLVANTSDTGAWSAVTVFECPLQSDFFADSKSPAAH